MNESDQLRRIAHLEAALRKVSEIGSSGSDEHRLYVSGNLAGWRVAEKMREVALESLGET